MKKAVLRIYTTFYNTNRDISFPEKLVVSTLTIIILTASIFILF